jgi:hypothetical protein
MVEMRNAYKILVVKPQGKGILVRRREDNIKMDITEILYERELEFSEYG